MKNLLFALLASLVATSVFSQNFEKNYQFGFKNALLPTNETARRQGIVAAFDQNFGAAKTEIDNQYLRQQQTLEFAVVENHELKKLADELRAEMENAFQNGKINGEHRGFETALHATWQQIFEKKYFPLLDAGADFDFSKIEKTASQPTDWMAFAKNLGNIGCRKSSSDAREFSKLLQQANAQILENLASLLELDEHRRELLRHRYTEMHDPLAELLFPVFLKILKTKAVARRSPAETFPAFHACESFDLLLRAVWQNLATALATYLFENSEKVLQQGLGWGGSLQFELLGEVVPAVLEPLFQASKQVDFEHRRPSIERHCRRALENLIVETRSETYSDAAEIRLTRFHDVQLALQFKAILAIGIRTNGIRCRFDHEQKTVEISLPRDPRILEKIHHDYKITSAQHTVEDHCRILNNLKPVVDWLPHCRIEAKIFGKKRATRSLGIAQNPLDMAAVLPQIEQILQAVVEPCLVLPHGFYRLEILF